VGAVVEVVFVLVPDGELEAGFEQPNGMKQASASEKNSCHPLEFIGEKLRIIMPLLLCGSS
jgi:hypothetical protein